VKAVDELTRIAGAEATAKLIDRFGGTRLYVPVAAKPESELVAAVGMDAAVRLCRAFGGERIEVPRKHDVLRERILELGDRGLSRSAIALELKCTVRWVRHVLSSLGE